MNKQKIIDAVIHEIKGIREHATLEERNDLFFAYLDPRHENKCIYGQMTGSCYSKRAKEIANHISPLIVGDVTRRTPMIISGSKDNGFTILEWFIVEHPAANAQIIAYLREETDELPDLAKAIDE